jgi:hypothetical protein
MVQGILGIRPTARQCLTDRSNPMDEVQQPSANLLSDVRNALRVETVHHTLDDIQLVLDTEVDEIRVENDVVRRAELSVVAEEQRRRLLRLLNHFRL